MIITLETPKGFTIADAEALARLIKGKVLDICQPEDKTKMSEAEFYAKIEAAEADYRAGRYTRCATPEELEAFFESL